MKESLCNDGCTTDYNFVCIISTFMHISEILESIVEMLILYSYNGIRSFFTFRFLSANDFSPFPLRCKKGPGGAHLVKSNTSKHLFISYSYCNIKNILD